MITALSRADRRDDRTVGVDVDVGDGARPPSVLRIDEVAEGDAKPVNSGPLVPPAVSTTFHSIVLAVAPLVHAGVVIDTLAGAAPSTSTSTPLPSNERLPVASLEGVPAVPPVTSPPSTVKS